MTIKLQKILVPTDFSEHAAGALQAAESLARPFGATLHLLHVVQMPVVPTMPEAAPVVPVTFWQELREHALRNLEKEKARLSAAGVKCELEVIEDVPGFAIAAAAERCRADLIVMGSRGLTGIKHALLGSVAERTVRSAPCPVLTVKKGGPLRVRKIVVAMDFSPAARRALELAQSLAKSAGPAHVILVHAYYVPVELEQYLITHGKSIPDVLSAEATRDLGFDPGPAAEGRPLGRVRRGGGLARERGARRGQAEAGRPDRAGHARPARDPAHAAGQRRRTRRAPRGDPGRDGPRTRDEVAPTLLERSDRPCEAERGPSRARPASEARSEPKASEVDKTQPKRPLM